MILEGDKGRTALTSHKKASILQKEKQFDLLSLYFLLHHVWLKVMFTVQNGKESGFPSLPCLVHSSHIEFHSIQ